MPVHHLYACEPDADQLIKHLAFRSYMRAHPEECESLSQHKLELDDRFQANRKKYMAGKKGVMDEIIAKAMPEFASETVKYVESLQRGST